MADGYDPRWKVLGRIAAGAFMLAPNMRCNPYSNRLMPFLGDVVEGGYVIDATALHEHPRLVSWVVGGAMCDAGLRDFEHKPFGYQGTASIMYGMGGLEGDFATIAKLAADETGQFKGLDYVGPGIYAAQWAARGAKVGRRKGNVIAWEDGTETPIPPFEERYRTPDIPRGDQRDT